MEQITEWNHGRKLEESDIGKNQKYIIERFILPLINRLDLSYIDVE